MKKDMQKSVKERKQEAAILVRYANPKSKNHPSIESVTDILSGYIPYCGEKPDITSIAVTGYHKNDIIKSAYFRVETSNDKTYKIVAYQNLKARTQRQKEADKTATFPSGLFNIFTDEIK